MKNHTKKITISLTEHVSGNLKKRRKAKRFQHPVMPRLSKEIRLCWLAEFNNIKHGPARLWPCGSDQGKYFR